MSSAEIQSPEVKLAVGRFIELAYSKDKGMTAKILAKGKASMTINENGDTTFSGNGGMMTFSGNPVLQNIGLSFKRMSVSFTNQDGMKVGYVARINAGMTFSVKGNFDLEELITSCSGLLCQAARALKSPLKSYDRELQQIMGN
ncbi:hypothetical protein QCD60_25955 [Pokkaliibacter sp. MBI-7]|uniref:hypothetical protein n=1 Tax=Pokkaliibacter sp. MBI-7 TaxID=3040600 RepID=UPI00244C6B47|nr:hypothetical protein [Pokkaliibacter sp. MBI-7]MDH2435980.1 hypothetical protein [Pokkaliibacter sp. MBI-7]